MTIVCTATGCTSRMGDLDKNDIKISFHRFPKNPELQEKWVRHMRRADWRPSNYSRLCSLHFEPACYQDGLARRVLHSYAVPTIFSIQSSVVKKCPKKRRLLFKSSIEASTSSACQECQNESVKCPKKRRLVLNTSNEASTSSANPECQDENDDPVKKRLQSQLEHYKMLAERRGKKLKNLQRKFSRVAKKKANLEAVINDLKLEEEKKSIVKNSIDLDNPVVSRYLLKAQGCSLSKGTDFI